MLFETNLSLQYPQKSVIKRVPVRTFIGGIIRFKDKILIQKRDSQMLNGLWEIPMKQVTLDSNYIFDQISRSFTEIPQIKVQNSITFIFTELTLLLSSVHEEKLSNDLSPAKA